MTKEKKQIVFALVGAAVLIHFTQNRDTRYDPPQYYYPNPPNVPQQSHPPGTGFANILTALTSAFGNVYSAFR